MRFTSVALFMGAAMSITAFPVLARILTERNLHKTKVGAIAITCAAVDDVTAWCMLAFVVGVARAKGLRAGDVDGGAVGRLRAGDVLRRPPVPRAGSQTIYDRQGRLSQNVVAVDLPADRSRRRATTEAIGIHALFGAFLMGAIMPKGTQLRPHAQREARGLHGRLPAADLLRLHGPEDADRPAQQRRAVAR